MVPSALTSLLEDLALLPLEWFGDLGTHCRQDELHSSKHMQSMLGLVGRFVHLFVSFVCLVACLFVWLVGWLVDCLLLFRVFVFVCLRGLIVCLFVCLFVC